jgi:hypothetical protein
VPVDEASVPPSARRWVGRLAPQGIAAGLAAGIAAVLGFGGPTPALADGPAVSAPNGKISAQGGAVDGDGSGIAVGTLTLPLGEQFGAQADGALGTVGGDFYGAGGGHLFWRDPEAALVGLTASYANLDGIGMQRYGAEAEIYLPQVTFGLHAGYQAGEVDHGVFGTGTVSWYATDDLRLTAGGGYAPDNGFGKLGVEYQPGFAALPGLAFFADGEISGDNSQAFAGFRYYFGETKSLKLRHRQDDPGDVVTDIKPLQDEKEAQDDNDNNNNKNKPDYGGDAK